MADKLTLFYMKRTGDVKAFCTGEQSMKFYGEYAEDYGLIMDYIVVDFDQFIIDNREYYKVINGELVFTKK